MRALLASTFLYFLPKVVFGAGLVTCGGPGTGLPPCQACHLVSLTNNVIFWIFSILAAIAFIIIVYIGYLFVLSRGESNQIKQGQQMFANIFIGMVIVFAAWLVVNLITNEVTKSGGSDIFSRISCVEQNPFLMEIVKSEIVVVESCFSTDSCAALVTECETRPGGEATITGQAGSFKVNCKFVSSDSSELPPDLSAAGSCDTGIISRYFPEQVGNAQCVVRGESACGANMVSSVDKMNDGRAFSYGPMQINLTVHELVGCGAGGATLDCKAAFSGRNFDAVVINEALYQQCAAAAQSPSCGLTNGRRIYDDSLRATGNGWIPWSAAGPAGCGLHG